MSTTIATKALTKTQARKLTDEVKADAAALWAKLLKLYEGEAHKALGYKSWGAYFEAEFGQSSSHGYQLLNAARVTDAITLKSNGTPIPTDAAAVLAPVLKHEGEQAVLDTYDQAVTEHGPKPTAKQVKETVQTREDVKQTILSRAGRGDAQKDIAKDLGVPITDVAKTIETERKAAKPKRARTAAPVPPPTLEDLAELAKDLLTAAKATSTAHAKFKKDGDLEDAKTAGFAAMAAGTAAAAYQNALDKHLKSKEPTT